MTKVYKTFSDYLIVPKFSEVSSRKDVDISSNLSDNLKLTLPVLSANMATITEDQMAVAMNANGGVGVLHRFSSVNENLNQFNSSPKKTFISIGISDNDKIRAAQLAHAGATNFCIDVAHGAQMSVVKQYEWLRNLLGKKGTIIVGNFATKESIIEFKKHVSIAKQPDLFKVGIGPGSACETRVKTGVGMPQLDAVRFCSQAAPVIADGGMKTPGDVCKALAAGAKAVMLGGMLAGTEEAACSNEYRGSAHLKSATYKTSEGAEFSVNKKGSVENILKDIAGGIRSSMTYIGARTLEEYREKAQLIEVSSSTSLENTAHFSS